jgi:lipopolysaccharide export LptBFGC system permease protein LptF
MGSDEEQVQAWQSLAMGLGFSSPDEEFWWTTFAQPLNRLMEWAQYPIFEQYRIAFWPFCTAMLFLAAALGPIKMESNSERHL